MLYLLPCLGWRLPSKLLTQLVVLVVALAKLGRVCMSKQRVSVDLNDKQKTTGIIIFSHDGGQIKTVMYTQSRYLGPNGQSSQSTPKSWLAHLLPSQTAGLNQQMFTSPELNLFMLPICKMLKHLCTANRLTT